MDELTQAPIAYSKVSEIKPGGMDIAKGTGPVVFTYLDTTRIYFTGSGSDGVWYSGYIEDSDPSWTQVKKIVPSTQSYVGIDISSSPALIILGSALYLFYSGSGKNGIWFTTTNDGNNWGKPQQAKTPSSWLGIMHNTTPCVILGSAGMPCIFYNGNAGNGIYCSVASNLTPGSTDWNPPTAVEDSSSNSMPILAGTSPSAATMGNTTFLFFAASGTGTNANTIYLTTWTIGMQWAPASALPFTQDKVSLNTSPTCVVKAGTLYLFWLSSDGLQTAVTSDGTNWFTGSSEVDASSFPDQSVVSFSLLNNEPSLFWRSSSGNVNTVAFSPIMSLACSPLSEILGCCESSSVGAAIYVDKSDDNGAPLTFLASLVGGAKTLSKNNSSPAINGIENVQATAIALIVNKNAVAQQPDTSDSEIKSSLAKKVLAILIGLGLQFENVNIDFGFVDIDNNEDVQRAFVQGLDEIPG